MAQEESVTATFTGTAVAVALTTTSPLVALGAFGLVCATVLGLAYMVSGSENQKN